MIVMAIDMPMMVAVMSSAPNRDEGSYPAHVEEEAGRTGEGFEGGHD